MCMEKRRNWRNFLQIFGYPTVQFTVQPPPPTDTQINKQKEIFEYNYLKISLHNYNCIL